MKEKMKKVSQFLGKKRKIKEWELIFGLAAVLFAGMVIGILVSPKGDRYFGCFNGNCSGNSIC